MEELNAIGVPSGPVLSVAETLADAQISERGLIGDIAVGEEVVQLAGSPVVMNGVRATAESPPPDLGAHNNEIWSEFGLSEQEINPLRDEGVI